MDAFSNPLNWREYIKDNSNFNQDLPFDFKSIFFKLQKASVLINLSFASRKAFSSRITAIRNPGKCGPSKLLYSKNRDCRASE